MTMSSWLPTVWPTRPSFQPAMTLACPTFSTGNVSPRSHDESNCVPSQSQPVYLTVTVWPAVTSGPVPLISGCTTSVVGAAPVAGVRVGLPVSSSVTVGRPATGGTVSPEARVGTSRASTTSPAKIVEPVPADCSGTANTNRMPTFWPTNSSWNTKSAPSG